MPRGGVSAPVSAISPASPWGPPWSLERALGQGVQTHSLVPAAHSCSGGFADLIEMQLLASEVACRVRPHVGLNCSISPGYLPSSTCYSPTNPPRPPLHDRVALNTAHLLPLTFDPGTRHHVPYSSQKDRNTETQGVQGLTGGRTGCQRWERAAWGWICWLRTAWESRRHP